MHNIYVDKAILKVQIFYPSQALKFGFAIKKNHIQATPNISLLLKMIKNSTLDSKILQEVNENLLKLNVNIFISK